MPTVPGFLPSRNGLRFANAWPSEPAVEVSVPGVGTVGIGNAGNGLCGGMVFTVRDVFQAGLPPLEDPRPPQGSPLFAYIVRRLIASFDIPGGVLKYYEWMNTADSDVDLCMVTRRGVAWRTIRQEWPLVRKDLDEGLPCPLGLVTVRSVNPMELGRNHQVLAYGYELAGEQLTLRVYDPNTEPALGDGVFLRLRTDHPATPAPIEHNVGITEPVRGFFRVRYTYRDPSALRPP